MIYNKKSNAVNKSSHGKKGEGEIMIEVAFMNGMPKPSTSENISRPYHKFILGSVIPFALGREIVNRADVVSVATNTFTAAQTYIAPYYKFLEEILSGANIHSSMKRMFEPSTALAIPGQSSKFQEFAKYISATKLEFAPYRSIEMIREAWSDKILPALQAYIGRLYPANNNALIVIDNLRKALFDDSLLESNKSFFVHFWNMLIFVLTQHRYAILIGAIGTTVLVYTMKGIRHIYRLRIENKKVKKKEVDFEEQDGFVQVLNQIGQHFGLSFISQQKIDQNTFVKFKYQVIEPKAMQKYKHFLKALPQNVFLSQVMYETEAGEVSLISPSQNTKLTVRQEQAKKYADVRVQRYSLMYPTTLTQRMKSYIYNKPEYSTNSISYSW